jgi:hypothetical protein
MRQRPRWTPKRQNTPQHHGESAGPAAQENGEHAADGGNDSGDYGRWLYVDGSGQ